MHQAATFYDRHRAKELERERDRSSHFETNAQIWQPLSRALRARPAVYSVLTTAPTTALTTAPPAVYVSVLSVTLTLVSGHVVVSGLVWGVRGVFGEFSTHSSDRILASIWFDSGYLYRFRPLPFPHSPGIPTHTRTPPNPACGFCRLSPGELSAESLDL